jgi:hypothetical protein
MRTRTALLAAALAPALIAGGAATGVAADPGGRPFSTELTGAAEAPDPGDPDATGTAALTLNQGLGQVCFSMSWADVDGEVFAAHIHEAPAGQAGDIVVPLFAGSFEGTDAVSDCVEADRELIKAIRQDPAEYYVNVHSLPDFGGGAIRGQLAK